MTTTINASTSAGLIQTADTSGSLQLQTVNLPAVTIDSSQNTTVNNSLTVNTNLTVTGTTTLNSSVLKSATEKTATGTSVDFTSIPSWVKRITVIFNNVSNSTSNNYLIQLVSGATTTTYVSSSINLSGASASNGVTSTSGLIINYNGSSTIGMVPIVNLSGNTWVSSYSIRTDGNHVAMGGGNAVLGGVLDRVTITTASGTATFSTGSFNIIYE